MLTDIWNSNISYSLAGYAKGNGNQGQRFILLQPADTDFIADDLKHQGRQIPRSFCAVILVLCQFAVVYAAIITRKVSFIYKKSHFLEKS